MSCYNCGHVETTWLKLVNGVQQPACMICAGRALPDEALAAIANAHWSGDKIAKANLMRAARERKMKAADNDFRGRIEKSS